MSTEQELDDFHTWGGASVDLQARTQGGCPGCPGTHLFVLK